MAKSTSKVTVYNDIVLGVLLYTVVLGFFNDYTNLLQTKSYSTTFAVAVVLQLLTFATLALKSKVILFYKLYTGKWVTPAMIFTVWFIMFTSKFVFLEILDIIFGKNLEISGFVGLLLIIVVMLVAQKLLETIHKKLTVL